MSLSPPTPPPHFAASAALFLIILRLFAVPTAADYCSELQSTAKSSCPPFTSTPSFPFSSSPGCGHPSFQIQCSSPHSIITINNLSFSLLRYETNSSSLLISPQPSTSPNHNCSSPHSLSIPDRSINLSGSAFRVSDWSCSRLSVLKPCPPPNLPNCSHCPWECKLTKNPAELLHECGSRHRQVSEQGCQGDILGFLDKLLSMGIEVEWDEDQDTYFSNCKACQANNGVCGFNSSDPQKQFVCFRSHSQMSPPWIRQDGPNRIAMLCLVFVLVCVLAVISIASVIFRSRRKSLATEEDPTILYLLRHRSVQTNSNFLFAFQCII